MEVSKPPDIAPSAPRSTRSHHKLLWLIVAVIVVVTAVTLVLFLGRKTQAPGSETASDVASEFYNALGNAAKQQNIRVAMYRETYANKADAAAKRNKGSIASSVSEVDVAGGKYRSVFAFNLLQPDQTFTLGRCLDGVTYGEAYNTPLNHEPRATSLQDIAHHLMPAPQGHLYKVFEESASSPCRQAGLYPADTNIAAARLSDGVFPVGLTDTRAAAWAKAVTQAQLFNLKDEGIVTKDGKQLRKISFTPKSDKGVNKKLYDIFYSAAEVDKIKTNPKEVWKFEFVGINPYNTGSVGGFYLIDQQTHLPVYSELYGTNPDLRTDETPAAGHNIARTKQTYTYPSAPTIDVNTPLEFLE